MRPLPSLSRTKRVWQSARLFAHRHVMIMTGALLDMEKATWSSRSPPFIVPNYITYYSVWCLALMRLLIFWIPLIINPHSDLLFNTACNRASLLIPQ
ncbi:hypothetical protein BDV28DRAFT_105572 [Aspergillus coremiiformis]|uniref:Uncharacterized protein n=1 Tax=Aspergillus coremiiformis TaxID=138285 RepID=A0A5N6ZA09_9EURO|nr:hypothetical protein BDV28DRAFT_105572 [Aspergillus coremiiformis]